MSTTNQTPLAIANAYLDAYTSNDIRTAAKHLAEDMEFHGPFVHCTSAKEFIGDGHGPGLATWAKTVTGIRIVAAFGDHEQALVMYELDTRPFGTLPTASRFTVKDGKIQTETTLFDPTPIHAARAAAQAPSSPQEESSA